MMLMMTVALVVLAMLVRTAISVIAGLITLLMIVITVAVTIAIAKMLFDDGDGDDVSVGGAADDASSSVDSSFTRRSTVVAHICFGLHLCWWRDVIASTM